MSTIEKASRASDVAQRFVAKRTVGDQLTGVRGVRRDRRPSALRRWYNRVMKIKAIVHEAEEGGYWAEVPAIPGCATQGETFDELISNLKEAIEGCLSVDVSVPSVSGNGRVVEIAV